MRSLIARFRKSPTQKVMVITLAGMLLGLLLDVLIAARLGTGSQTDSLIVALSIPLLIDAVLREGAKFSMVTYVIAVKTTLTEEDYHLFLSGILNLFLAGGFVIAFICWMTASLIVKSIGWGLSFEALRKSTELLKIMTPFTIFALGITALSAILASERRFSYVALRNGMAPAAVLVLLAIGWRSTDVAVWIVVGYVVGVLLYFNVLWRAVKNAGFHYVWSAWPDRRALAGILNATTLPMISFAVNQGSRIVERSMASLLIPGGVAIYYFGFRIFSALQSLIGYSIAMIGLPGMKASDLSGDKQSLSRVVYVNARKTVMMTLPFLCIIVLFSDSIVHILYHRGSFSGESSALTSKVLFWLALGMPFANILPVLNSCLYAIGSLRTILVNSIILAVANLSIAWMLSRALGLPGIAIGLVLSLPLVIAVTVVNLRRQGINICRFRNG